MHLAELEDPQELCLHGLGQLSDFVEKQRAAVSEFEQSRLVIGRAGEGAAHVPEQLALEQCLDDGGTVDGHEAALAAGPGLVQRAGDKFLARPGFTSDERGAHVRRQSADDAEQFLHQRAAADHAAELEVAGDVTLHGEEAATAVEVLAHGSEQLLETGEVERLAQIVHGPELDRFDRGVDGGKAGHQHRLALGIDVADGADDIEPADVRHAQVDHRDVGAPGLQLGDRLAPARARNHVVPGLAAEPGHEVEDPLLVVDNHERWAMAGHAYSLDTARTADRMARS